MLLPDDWRRWRGGVVMVRGREWGDRLEEEEGEERSRGSRSEGRNVGMVR
jgi:hypothetical protein